MYVKIFNDHVRLDEAKHRVLRENSYEMRSSNSNKHEHRYFNLKSKNTNFRTIKNSKKCMNNSINKSRRNILNILIFSIWLFYNTL